MRKDVVLLEVLAYVHEGWFEEVWVDDGQWEGSIQLTQATLFAAHLFSIIIWKKYIPAIH